MSPPLLMNTQSAENCKGFSETTRQLSDTEDNIFWNWFAGIIDGDGNLEFEYNEYSSKLNFDNTILNSKPTILKRKRSSEKEFSSLAFKFQNVNSMLFIYDYFMHNRLYSDIKFYRVSKIKPFVEIRGYKTSPKGCIEHKIYSDFMIDWIKYNNPLWYKVPFVIKHLTNPNK